LYFAVLPLYLIRFLSSSAGFESQIINTVQTSGFQYNNLSSYDDLLKFIYRHKNSWYGIPDVFLNG